MVMTSVSINKFHHNMNSTYLNSKFNDEDLNFVL